MVQDVSGSEDVSGIRYEVLALAAGHKNLIKRVTSCLNFIPL